MELKLTYTAPWLQEGAREPCAVLHRKKYSPAASNCALGMNSEADPDGTHSCLELVDGGATPQTAAAHRAHGGI